ncbi:hypothetical protein ABES02_12360 [Neobacillus pocheonensis]|uniref:hypothetical protein n=1 Tax=Neobacillus pocheonensis TaxID=363869 RepID=UPI003D26DCCC
MKYQKAISILVYTITILAIAATSIAIFSNQGPGEYKHYSIYGESVAIYGRGLYQHDSAAMAAQAIAQDYVTLFLAIPLLLVSLYMTRKGKIRGKLLLAGTLGYFLYTYASYSFLSMYNSLFLVYVSLMSVSFYAFVLVMMSFDIPSLPLFFSNKLPIKLIGIFLIFLSVVFSLMWLGKIVPSLIDRTPPDGLQHYTTLVIQALDLGFVIPLGILAGVLLMKRKPFGYLLSSMMIIKELTLLTALSAMVLFQILAGIEVLMIIFWTILLINLLVVYLIFLILKNIREPILNGPTNISA